MIRLRDARLTWGDEDAIAMAKILGAEPAAKGWAPALASVLKLADRRGVRLSTRAQDLLRFALFENNLLRANAAREDAPPQSHAECRAFPHQRVGLAFMRTSARVAQRRHFLLADQPGVGKTLLAMLRMAEVGASRILVVTPGAAKRQWRREIKRWLGPRTLVTIVDGTIPEQCAAIETPGGWVITHWESLVHARAALLADPWDGVILDEAHHIQNRDALRTETAHALRAEHRLALTGHPYANDPTELWSILHFLYPQEYSSFWRFVGMHVEVRPKPFGGFEVEGARRPNLLKWELSPFTLRRTKRQVYRSLPPIVRELREVELTKAGRREYERLRKEFFVALETVEPDAPRVLAIPSVLARVTRLRQYLVDPGILGAKERSAKFDEVRRLLDELDGPPVIFTEFQQAGLRLVESMRGKRLGFLHGDVKDRTRDSIQRSFLAGKFDALVVVRKLGGTALNLGKYGYVIHLDLPWNARDLEQSEGRVDRPEEGTGRLVPTTAYTVVVADSYEERLLAKVERKHKMFGDVFSTRRELEALFA